MIKRNKLEIIRDVLKTIQENRNAIKVTPLIRKSNLSSLRFAEYFNELSSKGFVVDRIVKSGKVISLTEKGYKYLEKYLNIVGFIEEFDL
ncbi:MAG TPA: winged helix-turn-helix domain-containing protein [Candidatus Nanoarchaeia archaeon]|nr:winged helix-turn-helix domain-containing protein [Candidatus Nanoarchaeia archaeon]